MLTFSLFFQYFKEVIYLSLGLICFWTEVIIFTFLPLHNVGHPLSMINYIFIFGLQQIEHTWVGMFILVWSLPNLLDLRWCFSLMLDISWPLSSHTSFVPYSCLFSPSGTPTTYIVDDLILSYRSEMIFLSFFTLFVLSLVTFHLAVLKFPNAFLLTPPNEFFISDIFFFLKTKIFK